VTSPIQDDSPSALLLRVNEENAAAYFSHLCRAAGVEIDDRPGRLRVATGIGHGVFNGVYVTRLSTAEADAYVEDTLAYFAANGLPWLWWVWPGAEPPDLAERLAARGLAARGTLHAMSVDLRGIPSNRTQPGELIVERVTSEDALAVAADVAGETFGLRPERRPRYLAVFSALGFDVGAAFQSYVGSAGGTPVAVSQSFLGAGVAGIYTVATLPEHRGRGYGTTLTMAPLRDARALGYRYGVLQSSKMGRPTYEGLGFRLDADVQLFGRPPNPASAPR